MIKRVIEDKLGDALLSGNKKALIIMGARQVGKTTSLHQLFGEMKDVLWLSGDEFDVQALFEDISSTRLRTIIGDNRIVVIDEAQRISDIGLKLKLITDNIQEVQLIATGSSAFELANRINEPLTGRKTEYRMFPLTFEELVEHHGLLEERRLLPHRLVFGYYPEVVTSPGKEKPILKELTNSYLFKDILIWDTIKKSDKLVRLLQALALQVGSEVSYTELGQICGIDNKTVEKYIDLLEKTYVVFRLGSFSRNLRNELKKARKVFFFDNGIRNALISNFSHIESRSDIGALWENFLIAERVKFLHYHDIWTNSWFWRTVAKQEIDLIEESDGRLCAYEFKWNLNKRVRAPKTFLEAYPESDFEVIHRDNLESFLIG